MRDTILHKNIPALPSPHQPPSPPLASVSFPHQPLPFLIHLLLLIQSSFSFFSPPAPLHQQPSLILIPLLLLTISTFFSSPSEPFSPHHQHPFSPHHQHPFFPQHQNPFSPHHQHPFSPHHQHPFFSQHQNPFSPHL